MAQQILFKLEVAILTALQVANMCFWVLALCAHFAHAEDTSRSGAAPVVAPSNPDLALDFMLALPPSQAIPSSTANDDYARHHLDEYAYRDEASQYYNHWISGHLGWVADSRFYTSKRKGDKRLAARLVDTIAAFGAECTAKDGHLEPHDSKVYTETKNRLTLRRSDDKFEICTKSASESLGAFAARTSWVSWPPRVVLIALRPSAVVTQADLYKEAEALRATEQRRADEATAELAEVERWRKTIKAGTETGCGPVLQINNDMVQVVYYQTREPKWYRRSELWPRRYSTGGLLTCR